ncbi:MAG: enoyl-CoA hydratase/carnithine racemase [Proteobacteria bacterium]|nr:enoyl-CoA hydratase/carnithine racemase [Pseudomonadota bacterium]
MITQPTALDTYLQRLPMILDKIEALRQLADDHFGHDPDAIHWGHVGDLGRVDQALDDLLAIFDGQAK